MIQKSKSLTAGFDDANISVDEHNKIGTRSSINHFLDSYLEV
jgi:hypothetical protein